MVKIAIHFAPPPPFLLIFLLFDPPCSGKLNHLPSFFCPISIFFLCVWGGEVMRTTAVDGSRLRSAHYISHLHYIHSHFLWRNGMDESDYHVPDHQAKKKEKENGISNSILHGVPWFKRGLWPNDKPVSA